MNCVIWLCPSCGMSYLSSQLLSFCYCPCHPGGAEMERAFPFRSRVSLGIISWCNSPACGPVMMDVVGRQGDYPFRSLVSLEITTGAWQ